VRDPVTGASKGVGFVSFDNFESSDQAIEAMNGQYLCGKALNVNYSLKKDGKGGEKHGSAAGKNNELSPFFVANFFELEKNDYWHLRPKSIKSKFCNNKPEQQHEPYKFSFCYWNCWGQL
jgi:RNA recognition motif-containing protein